MHVVATAGHVDHGKSTLVRALTGTDPDRLAEEKARGLTIDLGFASCTLPSGREAGFVDVPGHVRFIKNMLAGVGAVDACLFVVAATDGWMPQSEEHLRILEMTGVATGVVALTKVAALDEESRALAHLDVEAALDGSFLAGAPVVEVDAPAGHGVADLVAALDALLATTPETADSGRPRLWIDRVFSPKGAGTVVTGTLTGGMLRAGDDLEVAGAHAWRGPLRARALQSHGRPLHEAAPGRRLAVNLAGHGHPRLARGDALVRPGQWAPSKMFDATLRPVPGLGHTVTARGAFLAYIGTGEHPVRIRLLKTAALGPGEAGLVRLYLPVALPLLPGDRYVLREAGRSETLGGGEVLDVAPVLPASRASPDRSVERVVAERGVIEASLLERLTGARRDPNLAGRWVTDPAWRAGEEDRLRRAVVAAGTLGLDVSGLDPVQRALAGELPDLLVDQGRLRPASAASVADSLANHPFLSALQRSPFRPPEPEGVDPAALREMVRRGLVLDTGGCFFAASAAEKAAAVVADLLAARPSGVTVAEVRDALGTTRRYLLPLLAHLDATGVTRRRGDLRVPGPRLARLAGAAPPPGPRAGAPPAPGAPGGGH